MERYAKSGFGLRDLTKENHWEENVENFKITKPTFISLGGNGTINTHFANGSCSRMERLMGLKPKNADVYSTYKDVDLIVKRATKNPANGDLILMHPKTHTVQALPKIIDFNVEMGYRLVTVSENIS